VQKPQKSVCVQPVGVDLAKNVIQLHYIDAETGEIVNKDRRDIYDEATGYFRHGAGNGSIGHVVWKVYDSGIGQVQESGRDQGHTMLDLALLGAFCHMAWSQGDDLFGYDHNRVLLGAEYAARYNLGYDVPYTPIH
jgi:hypothetical protein